MKLNQTNWQDFHQKARDLFLFSFRLAPYHKRSQTDGIKNKSRGRSSSAWRHCIATL
jgi:hypothetical protein